MGKRPYDFVETDLRGFCSKIDGPYGASTQRQLQIWKMVSQLVIKGSCENFLPKGEKPKKINESSMMTHHVLKEHGNLITL